MPCVNPDAAKAIVRSRVTVIAALMLEQGQADAMICGIVGRYQRKLQHIQSVIPRDPGVTSLAAMTAVANDRGTFFFVDTHVQVEPSAEQLAALEKLQGKQGRHIAALRLELRARQDGFG